VLTYFPLTKQRDLFDSKSDFLYQKSGGQATRTLKQKWLSDGLLAVTFSSERADLEIGELEHFHHHRRAKQLLYIITVRNSRGGGDSQTARIPRLI
jgi:hypothetical protein